MTIKKTAEALDPAASIKAVKKNIIWLSLITFTSTRVILDLHSVQNSILIPPFDFLPTNSAFTFCFTFIFMHHKNSLLIFLFCILSFLVCRSIFDFFCYERNSEIFTKKNLIKFSFFNDLEFILSKYMGHRPLGIKKALLLNYKNRKIHQIKHDVAHQLCFQLTIADRHITNEYFKQLCVQVQKTISSSISYEKLNQDAQSSIIELYSMIAKENSKLKKLSYQELHHNVINYLSCIIPPIIGLVMICYSFYAFLTINTH